MSTKVDGLIARGRRVRERTRDVVLNPGDGIDRMAEAVMENIDRGLALAGDIAPGRVRRERHRAGDR